MNSMLRADYWPTQVHRECRQIFEISKTIVKITSISTLYLLNTNNIKTL